MLLQMTVTDLPVGQERTIEVRAESHHTLADLLEALGLPADSKVVARGATVPVDARVGLPPLLDGTQLVLGAPARTSTTSSRSLLRLVTTSGPDSGLTHELTTGRHVIGRGERTSLRVADPALSREHIALDVDRDGVRAEDLTTTNGTLVDGAPVPADGLRVRAGSLIRAGHTTFAVQTHRARPSRRRPSGAGTLAVNPMPHLPSTPPPARISIPEEPRAPHRRRIPWVMVLIPLPFAGLLALFFGPRMLLFGLLTPLLAIASALSDRSSSRREHRENHAAWVRDRARAGAHLSEALAAERRQRLHAAPDAAALLDAARGDSTRLWERRPEHEEHLALRLGLATVTARVEVDHGQRDTASPALDGVPLVVDLEEVGVLGVAGDRPSRDRLARHLLGQLTVLHSHHDVRVSVVADDEGWWSPFASLPHLREHDGVPGSARIAVDEDSATALLAGHAHLTRERRAEQDRTSTKVSAPTAHVLVVDDAGRWRTDPGLRAVLAHGREQQVLVLALAGSTEELPHECLAVAVLVGDEIRLRVAGREAARGTVDGTGPTWTRRVAAALAPLRDATPDPGRGGLPSTARLVELLDLDPDDRAATRARWTREGTPGPMDLRVVVGAGSEGEHHIDLRRDGPHALVAGTTGSGKSEFLQSWVAALAAHLSPEEISFVLVDYKGGAAFAECARLPHTVGLLTDLDPTQAERALTSLDAELTRREHILAASGAKDIDDHSGSPLPRLMIVIDEFRMLAEEQPDALAHLMRIAAVGRSLGVHLVLATQRPGGIVSADIKANVNLRIALRVRDRVDSDDVLGCKEAADIPEDAPGRALSRTGGSPARAFQTGRIAGHALSEDAGVLVRRPGEPWPVPIRTADPGPTDLQRLVRTLEATADDLGLAPPHRPWLPPLPGHIPGVDLPAGEADLGAPFGLLDLPDQQRQEPLCWTPETGHWMVAGGPGSGRTTTIAAVVTSAAHTWTPSRLQVQVIGDGSATLAALAPLPHVGSVIDGEDLPVLRRFLDRLDAEVSDRRALLRERGFDTLDAWWRSVDEDPAGTPPPPHLLLAIDGWGRLTRPRDATDLGESTELLETLLRDGSAVGLRALVAGGREMFSGRISSLLGNRLVLHLPDRGDAALAGLRAADLSTRMIPGRAHHLPGGRLAQVALPREVSSTYPSRHAETGARPWVATPLPHEVDLDTLPPATPASIPIGIGGSGQDPVHWKVPGARRFLVCGPARSGRSSTLTTLARQALVAGLPVAVLTGGGLDAPPGLDDCHHVDVEDREGLIALRQQHPDLAVVVDDADRVDGAPVTDVLREILRRVDADQGLVMAATSTQVATHQIRGLVAELGRSRTGVLLQPTTRADGDALGLRVPPLSRVPGRGYLVAEGDAREVQVAQVRGGVRGGEVRR